MQSYYQHSAKFLDNLISKSQFHLIYSFINPITTEPQNGNFLARMHCISLMNIWLNKHKDTFNQCVKETDRVRED